VFVDYIKKFSAQFQCPQSDRLLMFHNYACVLLGQKPGGVSDSAEVSRAELLVVGGGGNCFSFGTHLNSYLAVLTVEFGT
jgi:hypothetical protein